jgi:hypothetical protein
VKRRDAASSSRRVRLGDWRRCARRVSRDQRFVSTARRAVRCREGRIVRRVGRGERGNAGEGFWVLSLRLG